VATTVIKPMAVENGATVLSKVYDVSVMNTSGAGENGSTVRVLAVVNQATTTNAKKAPQTDQNRVVATMDTVDGRWLISRLDAF
jgi:Mce-associated membrane protein